MCHRQVFRWALGVVGDPDEADDVAQDVLVRLFRRLKSFKWKSRFSTWLFQVTRNTALEQIRKRVRREKLIQEQPRAGQNKNSEQECQLDRLSRSNVVQQIRMCFEQLPARQRMVFDLADLQGVSPIEIGERLGMNPVTVRANLCKARRAIRTKMLKQHPELVEGLVP